MPLSEEEQRLFEQLEAQLKAEDPKLAIKMRSISKVQIHGRRAALAGFVFVMGLVALIAGLRIHPVVSVLGFVLMLLATLLGLKAWSIVEAERPDGGHGAGKPMIIHPNGPRAPFF